MHTPWILAIVICIVVFAITARADETETLEEIFDETLGAATGAGDTVEKISQEPSEPHPKTIEELYRGTDGAARFLGNVECVGVPTAATEGQGVVDGYQMQCADAVVYYPLMDHETRANGWGRDITIGQALERLRITGLPVRLDATSDD